MHQRLKDLGVPIPTGPDAVPSLPSAPVPLGNIIPAPAMGVGQPYPLLPQIPVGPTEFLSVNGMVNAEVLADDEEYKEVSALTMHTDTFKASLISCMDGFRTACIALSKRKLRWRLFPASGRCNCKWLHLGQDCWSPPFHYQR